MRALVSFFYFGLMRFGRKDNRLIRIYSARNSIARLSIARLSIAKLFIARTTLTGTTLTWTAIAWVTLSGMMISGCSDKPTKLLQENVYLNVLTELAFVNETDAETRGDMSRSMLADSVYEAYGVTPDQFHFSHEHYQRDTKKHQERIQIVKQRIQTERERLQDYLRKQKTQAAQQDSLSRQTRRIQRPKVPSIPPSLVN